MQELLPLIALFSNEIKQFNLTQTLILHELKEIKEILLKNAINSTKESK